VAAEAYAHEIENRLRRTEAAFQMRQINRTARAVEGRPRPTHDELVRWARRGKPERPSPSELDTVTGELTWPLLLQASHYTEYRQALETLFLQRAADGTIGPAGYLEIHHLTDAMLKLLKDAIREAPPDEYMLAKRFLQSLAHEAGQPAG
jgi:hypothetical protein